MLKSTPDGWVYGVETRTSTPEELGRFVKSETARFGKVSKSAGIKPI
jgi:hypothetical protein